jgi:hypothetical protein
MNYSLIVPSNRPNLKDDTISHLKSLGLSPIFKDGSNYPSFSKLINDCVIESINELIIICNDKARPKLEDFDKMINLINQGYGFVGLYAWGFFGFKKELFRRVGFMDERFVGGNYEDCDYLRRMMESNIAMYNVYEIPYIETVGSNWNKTLSKIHYDNKWMNGDGYVKRLMDDEIYNYDIGEITGETFLPWSESILGISQSFVNYKINN